MYNKANAGRLVPLEKETVLVQREVVAEAMQRARYPPKGTWQEQYLQGRCKPSLICDDMVGFLVQTWYRR